jgi:hypothetical protein
MLNLILPLFQESPLNQKSSVWIIFMINTLTNTSKSGFGRNKVKIYLRESDAFPSGKNGVFSWHYDCYLTDHESNNKYQFLSRKKFKTEREVYEYISSDKFYDKINNAMGKVEENYL